MSKVVKQTKFLNKISFTTKKPQILIDTSRYSSIKLTFQAKNHNGHMGARMFWRNCLPTLQFYNPSFKFDVIRIKNDKKSIEVPCKLEVFTSDGKVAETIDMQNRMYDSIMDEVLQRVEHKSVPEDQLIKIGN